MAAPLLCRAVGPFCVRLHPPAVQGSGTILHYHTSHTCLFASRLPGSGIPCSACSGIIHVEDLGTWAWATYTALLALICLVAVFKDA